MAEEDIAAYVNFAEKNYKKIFLAGHSFGANKVIYYLSKNFDERVKKFILLSPANLDYMTKNVSEGEKKIIEKFIRYRQGEKILPFEFMGWVICTANTASDCLSKILNNVHVEVDGDFSQVEKILHSGALLIGTYDNFTCGAPKNFFSKFEQILRYNFSNCQHARKQNFSKICFSL